MSEEMALVAFQIITAVGTARTQNIEAKHKAGEGRFEEAEAKIKEGQKEFTTGHHAHADLIAKEAGGEKAEYGLLIMHAEDQLMSAEAFGILAEEFITVYKKMK